MSSFPWSHADNSVSRVSSSAVSLVLLLAANFPLMTCDFESDFSQILAQCSAHNVTMRRRGNQCAKESHLHKIEAINHHISCGRARQVNIVLDGGQPGKPLDYFFEKGTLFRGKGGPPVLEQPVWHLPRQGRRFVRPPVCPTPPTIGSTYRGASGGQVKDCWHLIFRLFIAFHLSVSGMCQLLCQPLVQGIIRGCHEGTPEGNKKATLLRSGRY